jgi:riboflavin synthase
MFTGIIETIGKVVSIQADNTNLNFRIESNISDELKIDQSISHNGVCLTVVATQTGEHTVTAVAETLTKSNLGQLRIDDEVNL